MNSIPKNNAININNTSPKYISQNDFIYFKNELLKDLKTIETKLTLKMDSSKKELENKFLNFENQFNAFKSKKFETPPQSDIDKVYSEKINKLFFSKTKIEDKIAIHEKRLKELNDYYSESIYSINKLIQEKIMCPGIVGNNSKFPTFQILIDHLISNINILNEFKDKMSVLDMHNYKTKLDKLIQSIKIQMDQIVSSSNKLTADTLITFEKKTNELFNIIDNKLNDVQNDLENKINVSNKTIIEQANLINKNRIELLNEINKVILENKNTFNNINLKFERCFNEIGCINTKCEETNENMRKIKKDLEEKMKEHEYKLIAKISHVYRVMKDFNTELSKQFKSLSLNSDGVQYNNFDLNKLFENNINIIKNNEIDIPNIQLKSSHSVGSILKKYIEGEIGLNDFFHFTRNKIKKKESKMNNIDINNSNDSENKTINNLNINKFKDFNSNNNIKVKNATIDNILNNKNVKYIKLDNKNSIINKEEKYPNKMISDRKKIDNAVIENGNIILNQIPRKEIIKTLLMGNIDPFTFYLMKNKLEKKNLKIKLNMNQKSRTSRIKNNFLSKGKSDFNLSSKERFRNNSSIQFDKKNSKNIIFKVREDVKQLSKDEINKEHPKNQKTLSDEKSRNYDQYSLIVHNNTDVIKENSKHFKKSPIKDNNMENKTVVKNGKINNNSLVEKIYDISFKKSLDLNKNNANKNKILKKDKNIKSRVDSFRTIKINKKEEK